jgi:hypothetical protein
MIEGSKGPWSAYLIAGDYLGGLFGLELLTSLETHRLEKVVRDSAFRGDHGVIQKIVDQLCHDYAYAVHQPHARNGGLIGLAAASIALGSVSLSDELEHPVDTETCDNRRE